MRAEIILANDNYTAGYEIQFPAFKEANKLQFVC